jgi:AraC-like DNA-binding protein
MSEAESPPARTRVFAEALGRIGSRFAPPAPDMNFTFRTLGTDSAGRALSVVLDSLGVSPRTLRRRCGDAFGYGPKTLERILRFQRFLRLLRRSDALQLVALALEAGYADQAHLTREVRRLSGFSPAALVAQLRPEPDVSVSFKTAARRFAETGRAVSRSA